MRELFNASRHILIRLRCIHVNNCTFPIALLLQSSWSCYKLSHSCYRRSTNVYIFAQCRPLIRGIQE